MKYILKIAVVIILSCLSSGVYSGIISASEELKDDVKWVEQEGKWSLVDSSGKVLTAKSYDEVGPWVERKAKVVFEGKTGFVDRTGKEIVATVFEEVRNFSKNGLAGVRLYEKWGFIDTLNQMVVSPKYGDIKMWADGVIPVKSEEKWGLMNAAGKEVVPFLYENMTCSNGKGIVIVQRNNRWGVIDITGRQLIPVKYDQMGLWSDGMVFVFQGGKQGIVNSQGREVVAPVYDRLSNMGVKQLIVAQKDGKCGLINYSGIVTVAFKYDRIQKVSKELMIVSQNKKWGLLNFNGKTVLYPKYDTLALAGEGLLRMKSQEKWGFIDLAGKEIVPPVYEQVTAISEAGIFGVKQDNLWGFADRSGKTILPVKYSHIGEWKNGMIWVNIGGKKSGDYVRGGKFGFVNARGEEVVSPCYEAVRDFEDCQLALVNCGGFRSSNGYIVSGKCGFIDSSGRTIVPIKYDYVGKWGENNYNKASVWVNIGGNFNVFSAILSGGKYGIIDAAGREIVPVAYKTVVEAERLSVPGAYLKELQKTANLYSIKDKIPEAVWNY